MYRFSRIILHACGKTSTEVNRMKKRKGQPYPSDPAARYYPGQPDDCAALVNQYGTYNIQPTADADNLFPAIAQGLPRHLYENPDEETT